MLGSDAVSDMQRQLGFRSDLAAECLTELQNAQVRYESGVKIMGSTGSFLPWFLLTEVASVTTVASEERVPLPADFIREEEDDALWRFNPLTTDVTAQWTELQKDELAFLRGDQPGTGTPLKYCLLGVYWRLKPTPDTTYTLKAMYKAKDTVIASGTTNKWLTYCPFLLIGGAGYRIAAAARDQQAMGIFAALEQDEIVKLFAQHEARGHVNRRYAMGDQD